MTLEEIRQYIQIKLNKNQQGWSLTPVRFNILLKALNIDYYESKVQKPDAPNMGYEFSKKYIDLFRVFKKRVTIPLVDQKGVIPDDYRHYSSVYYDRYYNSTEGCDMDIDSRFIPYIKDSKLIRRITSSIEKPTLDFPLWTFIDNEIVVYPKEIKNIVFTYLRKPLDPYYDYDIVSSKEQYLPPGETHVNSTVEPIGSASKSVELEYPEAVHIEIADWLYEVASTSLKDQLNIQMAMNENKNR